MRNNRQPKRASHRAAERLPAERIRGRAAREHGSCARRFGDPDDRADVPWILNVHRADDELKTVATAASSVAGLMPVTARTP